ncbi:MAG: nucleotidyl transferase AbiEii/AbiGii toxin family protein [Microcella pacifica]|uniref:Nucleotidyl transferase AbiEii/AbiGii toxin family protein n=1 Tax=Microcella pacifica TaxID=2591847 RepID=A0A9E5MHK8_9MICO|nr:nucleotidyl transferase AbiEii/AbiGii toxin family protein [Microcella pacifica]NHF62495.1 nucleotidyl transferase AbiEii/AbiGii toxin family protein [Microcella pacifica]
MSTPQPGVLAETELRAVAKKFGVADEQVRRDHLISHVLASIQFVPGVVFYGGTALTRTVLPDLRLSEDVDLLVSRSRREVARELSDAIDDGLARSFGEVNWVPALDATHDAQPATLEVLGRMSVQVQIVDQIGRAVWPTERRAIDQRYSDAPPAELESLTNAGFAAAKISAWLERRECRDLFDLWALASAGLLDSGAKHLVRRSTIWSRFPQNVVWPTQPDESTWQSRLSHQTRLRVAAADAYAVVRSTLERWATETAERHNPTAD